MTFQDLTLTRILWAGELIINDLMHFSKILATTKCSLCKWWIWPRIILSFYKKLLSGFTSLFLKRKAEISGINSEKDKFWILLQRNSLCTSFFIPDLSLPRLHLFKFYLGFYFILFFPQMPLKDIILMTRQLPHHLLILFVGNVVPLGWFGISQFMTPWSTVQGQTLQW
jgi:hypothetical protein